MENSKKEFNKGYSKCCNDALALLKKIPEDATKEYITHYLFSELHAKYALMENDDDTT